MLLKLWARSVASTSAGDAGMSTAEYAVGTVAACGFAGLLVKLLTSDQVRSMLSGVISRAFTVVF